MSSYLSYLPLPRLTVICPTPQLLRSHKAHLWAGLLLRPSLQQGIIHLFSWQTPHLKMLPQLLAPQRKTVAPMSRTHSSSSPNFHFSFLSSNYRPQLDGYYIIYKFNILNYYVYSPHYNHYILKVGSYVLYSISPALYRNACHVGAGELGGWMSDAFHMVTAHRLWLFEKENQYSCNILVPRSSSLWPHWNNLLRWLVHYVFCNSNY